MIGYACTWPRVGKDTHANDVLGDPKHPACAQGTSSDMEHMPIRVRCMQRPDFDEIARLTGGKVAMVKQPRRPVRSDFVSLIYWYSSVLAFMADRTLVRQRYKAIIMGW